MPDPFQLEAIEFVKTCDVIVTAPTGSGKTWIAEKAIERELSENRNVWYASPLKALSNSKFIEFGKIFGEDNIGLLTGDHKLNLDSPVIVGTTEILRNQLYDSMERITDIPYDLVILDEAHYLGDKERGVVWEEVLIYLPSRVRLLLLSATIENAEDIAFWLSRNRGTTVKVVYGGERPVPLIPICLHKNELELLEEATRKRKIDSAYRSFNRKFKGNHQLFQTLPKTFSSLYELDLLPAIFFLSSRSDCDHAVNHLNLKFPEPPERTQAREQIIEEFFEKNPYLKNYRLISKLNSFAMASHHAGHLPQYKMLVEELMSKGLLSAIFATSTVSAGVNFPARTVVIPQSDRFNGSNFSALTATELAQMTGRAGRRGRDLIGFALLLPGNFMNLKMINGLFKSPPNPIMSHLEINFSMVLNLLKAYNNFEDIRFLFAKSFSAWQQVKIKTEGNLEKAAKKTWNDFRFHMQFLKNELYLDPYNQLTARGKSAALLRLNHPLVYFAAVENNGLSNDPALLAAAISAITEEEPNFFDENSHFSYAAPSDLKKAIIKLQDSVNPLIKRLKDNLFQEPYLSKRKCLAIYTWATKHDFELASYYLGRGEGDMVRCALMAIEYLHQLSNLDNYPEIASTAQEARELLFHPPII
ncbi:MAG: DEAD/DEAH box helicase [Deltaproteobacteria bacterium]|nr:DEAD/DEAH box helicase [Deltaproteobacteria bacterium]